MNINVEDLYLKGFMAYSSGDFATAQQCWEKVLAADPNHEGATRGMSDLQARQGQGKRRSSKEVLQEIKKHYAAKQYDQALKLCAALLKKHPNNADLRGLYKKIESRAAATAGQPTAGQSDAGRPTAGQPNTAPAAEPAQEQEQDRSAYENTMVLQNKAESSLENEPDDDTNPAADNAKQVEKLIQNGVSLYDVQDYEQAITVWEKALALDPDNRIAKDYINNVRPLLAESEPEPEPPPAAPAPPPAAAKPQAKPGKAEMVKVYNEAMKLYKQKDLHGALDKWQYILQFYPKHKETLQCVHKTKEVMAKLGMEPKPAAPVAPAPQPPQAAPPQAAPPQPAPPQPAPPAAQPADEQPAWDAEPSHTSPPAEHSSSAELDLGVSEEPVPTADSHDPELLAKLEQARRELASGNHVAAESILTRLSIEDPDLPGLDQVRVSLEQRKKQITELRNLEIEEAEDDSEYSATDDEITKFFTPESTGDSRQAARQVAEVVVPKKEQKKTSKLLVFGLPLFLMALGAGGYFGYEYYKKTMAAATQAPPDLQVMREVDWNSAQQKARDFSVMGEEFANEGNYLLAALSYERVLTASEPRLSALADQGIEVDDFVIRQELNDLNENRQEARTQVDQNMARFKPAPIDAETWDTELERAAAEMERGRFPEAIRRLTDLLGNDPENETVRKMLGNAQLQMGFRRIEDNELDEALSHFKRATVLLNAYDMPRRHKEVIERFFRGDITREEKDQWFFFFLE